MQRNVFIFHGTEGYPEENWFPWFKEKLEAKGCRVFVPQFPSPKGEIPKLDEWFDILKNYEQYINEDTIFIGHSLGGMFLLHMLEKFPQKILAGFFVSVAPGYSFGDLEFDWEKIKEKTKKFIVFHSDNDPWVPLEKGKELAHKLGVDLIVVPNAGHFNTKSGYTTFPQLLDEVEKFIS